VEVGGNRGDLPRAAPHLRRLGKKLWTLALVVTLLHAAAASEQLVDARAEAAGEILDERDGRRGEDALGSFDAGSR
jgi:hypothetical protein